MPFNIYYLAKAYEDLEVILDYIAQDSVQRAQDYLQFQDDMLTLLILFHRSFIKL